MLYFQLSEPEYNSLRRVQDQLGLISSLIMGAYPGHALEPVTPGQLLAFIQAQEETLEAIIAEVRERGVAKGKGSNN
ncbi:hypothetical protein WKI45_05140 [Delftia tsuruhatensis]